MNLLVAAMPHASVRDAIEDRRRSCLWPEGYWLANPDRLHMTLCQLGDVPGSRLKELRAVLAEQRMEKSELLIRMPRPSESTTEFNVQVTPAFSDFRNRMHRSLALAGFSVKGGRRPHITLSYDFLAVAPPVAMPAIPWVPCEFVLIWSQLKPQFAKAKHVRLGEFPAQAPRQQALFSD
ncbi:MAG: hypothetical protein ABI907_08375 [Ramlibacter sp.]